MRTGECGRIPEAEGRTLKKMKCVQGRDNEEFRVWREIYFKIKTRCMKPSKNQLKYLNKK